jgi:hypothetical protein
MNPLNDVSSFIRVAMILLGLAAATFIGLLVGESNWTALTLITSLVVLTSVTQFTVRHLVAICLALGVLDFWMAPAGFKISPMEQMGIVTAFCYLLVCWRRNFNLNAPINFTHFKSFIFFQNITLVAAVYALSHFIYNYFAPYEELAFGWRGASKAYAQTFGAFLMIVFLIRARLLFPLGQKRSITLLRVLLATLIISVIIAIVRSITIGADPDTSLSREDQADLMRVVTIPFLNAHDSVYTLRTLGPAAVLIGATFFFSRPPTLGPILPLALMTFGLIGSIFSAGRAAVIFCFGFTLIAVVRSGRGLMGLAMCGLLFVVVALLVISPTSLLKETPWHFQRSIAWLRPDMRTSATEGIQSSSDMRWRYFNFAWDQYTSGDARMILFGRSVGQMDSVDVLSFVLYNELAQMEFAVRRLATHNGLTDFLLGWGLIGYGLIIAISISCCIMLYSYLRHFRHNSHGACWLFSAATFMSFWLIYTHIGGSFVWPLAIALVLVALSQTDGLIKREQAVDEAITQPKHVPASNNAVEV